MIILAILFALVLVVVGVFMVMMGLLLMVFHPLAGTFVVACVLGALYWLWWLGHMRLTRPNYFPRGSKRL